MKLEIKNQINWLNLGEIFLFFFVLTLFFPVRYVFLSRSSFSIGIYSDFTSFSLHLSDIFLIITGLFVLIPRGKLFFKAMSPFFSLILWYLVIFLIHSNNRVYSLYFLAKVLEFVVAYGTTVVFYKEKAIKSWFFWAFVILSSFQSLIALAQFYIQRPLGLFKLGEQQIYPINQGIAKIIIHGSSYIRGYGTFPHPNLLSAYLLAAIFISLYLFSIADTIKRKILLCIFVLINVLGITVTFSRAAFFTLACGLIIYFGFLCWQKFRSGLKHKSSVLWPIIAVIVSIIISFVTFHSFLITRATISDQAVVERGVYNNTGFRMIKNNPLFGLGLGESVLHMQQYSQMKLWPWQIQPIHNYFLLAASELGIPGALILIWIFWHHLKKVASRMKQVSSGDNAITTYLPAEAFPRSDEALAKLEAKEGCLLFTTLLSCFFILMFFDHYFYTLQQTQMLLWIILGVTASESKTK